MITQEASEAVLCNIRGSSPTSGTTKVCMSEATMPATAITLTTPPGRAVDVEPPTSISPRPEDVHPTHHVLCAQFM
ncbi:hypothetical protein GCM10010176_061910 [Nonomuraea spiralis]|nr:hypothetical protein GCM10010176_061910 [Nonomuraea spiralis]